MRVIRFLLLTGMVGTIFALSHSAGASALTTTSAPEDYLSPVFITAFQFAPVNSNEGDFNVLELYNSTEQPINMKDWKTKLYVNGQLVCDITLAEEDVYIPPESYVVIAHQDVFGGVNESIAKFATPCIGSLLGNKALQLVSPGQVEETVTNILSGAYVRKGLTATYRDEDDAFADNFSSITTREGSAVYAGPWYIVDEAAPIQISEIVPRARICSPLDEAIDCNDYVKLYNPTGTTLSLDRLRLRIGHKNQSPTSSNAIALGGSIAPNSYGVITKKVNGEPLSITDSGGWIWLEDIYGLKQYENTVVPYVSASSSTKIGWAWAYDVRDGMWKWTSTTTPYNQSSRFTLPEELPGKGGTGTLTPCRDDQYRNPLTNRCKLIASSASSLKACASNQYRSLETNRCRLVSSSSSSSLKSCAANQYRNPETNRCRLIASTASSLKPCAAGQERNPATNRCRKVVGSDIPAADFPVETVRGQASDSVGWLAFAGVGSMAAGYGVWEWRREMSGLFTKLMGVWKK